MILGDYYKFSISEIEVLNSNYSEVIFISEISTNDDIKNIYKWVSRIKETLIVLNIDKKVPKILYSYLAEIKSNNVQLLEIEDFFEKKMRKVNIKKKNVDIPLLQGIKSYSTYQFYQKRIIDYIGMGSLLALFWPVILYSMYRIKKESPEGPIFFKQKRVGLYGKEFVCLKFRTMNVDAEKNGAQFSSKNDPRVFSWGKFMRKTRIDELPQLFNVLKGEMHFIGPRPERKIWTDQFETKIPHYSERYLVRPGITGWAQVMYPYGENAEDARQKLMYDLYYMKRWSIFLELEIIFRTIKVVINRSNNQYDKILSTLARRGL